jgi:mono/diheme cytochrome c family protein
MKRLILSAALLIAASSVAYATDGSSGDAAKGRQLFTTIGCSYCHGTAGQGGGGRTGGLRISHLNIGYEAFLTQLRHPRNEMPPYVEAALPDKDVADIFAFVESLPPPPDVKSIPLLN